MIDWCNQMEDRSQCKCVSFNILCEETEKKAKFSTRNSHKIPMILSHAPVWAPKIKFTNYNSKSRSPSTSKQLRLDRAFVRPPWIPLNSCVDCLLVVATSCKVNCRASAENTRVFGDYFVIIEHCTVDTKAIWWHSHDYSKSTFICKYNCTIKGLKTKVVLEEKLYGHAFSWQDEPSFVKQEAHSTKHSFCLSAGGRSAGTFPCQPPESWQLWFPWSPPIQRLLAVVQSLLFSIPASKQTIIINCKSINQLPAQLSLKTLIRLIEVQQLLGFNNFSKAAITGKKTVEVTML